MASEPPRTMPRKPPPRLRITGEPESNPWGGGAPLERRDLAALGQGPANLLIVTTALDQSNVAFA